MSTIKVGWLNDKNGDKFAPKTLTSQVTNNEGVSLDILLENSGSDIDSVKTVNGVSPDENGNITIDIPSVPTKTSQLTNDSGFITTIPSEYITESELDASLDGFGGTVEVTSGAPSKENTVMTLNPNAGETYIYTIDEVDKKFDNVNAQVVELSEQKADKSGMTLDKHTDGLIYLFVDGEPVGNGVEITGEVVEGDVIGTLDENNNILLSGALADGTYTLKYENEDGTYTEVGNLVVGEVTPPASTYTNLFDPSTASINTRWSCTSGSTSAKDGFVASAKIDFGKNMSIPAVANATDALMLRIRPSGMFLALSDCNIQYFDSDGVRNGGWYLQGATNGITMGTDENGDTYIYLAHQGTSTITGVRYFAIGLKVSDSAITTDDIQDIIITLNEPITD